MKNLTNDDDYGDGGDDEEEEEEEEKNVIDFPGFCIDVGHHGAYNVHGMMDGRCLRKN